MPVSVYLLYMLDPSIRPTRSQWTKIRIHIDPEITSPVTYICLFMISWYGFNKKHIACIYLQTLTL